jgi:hypothetical protein
MQISYQIPSPHKTSSKMAKAYKPKEPEKEKKMVKMNSAMLAGKLQRKSLMRLKMMLHHR